MTVLPHAVVILGRAPSVPGKTRLTSGLRPGSARRLRTALLLDTVEAALSAGGHVHLMVTPADGIAECQALLDGDGHLAPQAARLSVSSQVEGDLGVRIAQALAFRVDAAACTLVVGSDVPALSLAVLKPAVAALHEAPAGGRRTVVLAPSRDGGYALIGATHPVPELCTDVPWSTPEVWRVTCQRAESAGITVRTLPGLDDLDTGQDLAVMLVRRDVPAPRIRVWAAGHGAAQRVVGVQRA